MGIAIRPYRLVDRAELIQVIDVVCAEGVMHTRRFEPTPAWRHALEEPDCACHLLLVASDGGRVVGWCRLFPAEGSGELELGVGVLGSYRRRGVGKKLLSRGLEWASKEGVGVVLGTRPDNYPAIRLFEWYDFRITGRENGLLTMRHPPGPYTGERERRS